MASAPGTLAEAARQAIHAAYIGSRSTRPPGCKGRSASQSGALTGAGKEVCPATGQNASCCHERTNSAWNGWLSGRAGSRVYFCPWGARANRKKRPSRPPGPWTQCEASLADSVSRCCRLLCERGPVARVIKSLNAAKRDATLFAKTPLTTQKSNARPSEHQAAASVSCWVR